LEISITAKPLQSYFVSFDAGILSFPVMPAARFSTSAGVIGGPMAPHTSLEAVGVGVGVGVTDALTLTTGGAATLTAALALSLCLGSSPPAHAASIDAVTRDRIRIAEG
jgi:hypothetical protein